MKPAFFALVVAATLILPATVSADGYRVGPQTYHWVYPPHYRRLINIFPSAVVQTLPLSESEAFVSPADAQVTIEIYKSGTFGFPAGQHGMRVGITPLRHYYAPHRNTFMVDGNVYGLSFRYVPSGSVAVRADRRVVITLDAPHNTPSNIMMGRFQNKWSPLCSRQDLLLAFGLPSCLTKRLPNAVAIFYNPFSHYGSTGKAKKHKKSTGPSPFIIGAIVIVVLWGTLILFLLTRSRGPIIRTRLA